MFFFLFLTLYVCKYVHICVLFLTLSQWTHMIDILVRSHILGDCDLIVMSQLWANNVDITIKSYWYHYSDTKENKEEHICSSKEEHICSSKEEHIMFYLVFLVWLLFTDVNLCTCAIIRYTWKSSIGNYSTSTKIYIC